jgi:hypothetical protein
LRKWLKPKPREPQAQRELFRAELALLVDGEHPQMKMAQRIDWASLTALFHPELS